MFLFVGLLTLALGDRLTLRRLAPIVPAVLLGAGLATPLLLHQVLASSGIERFEPMEPGVYDNLPSVVLPYPLAETQFPTPWGSYHAEKLGEFFFFGGLFALLFALQALAFWLYLPQRSAWSRSWWVVSGIVALLMVLGRPGMLWQEVAHLPLSKMFLRYTFRFYPWLAFCAILSGGLILERVLATLQRRQRWELIVGGLMLVVLAYHMAMCRASFYLYGFQPYPELPAEFEATFHPYPDKSFVGDRNSRRFMSWTQLRSPTPAYYSTLQLNLPHYYQVPTILGYDPVIEGQPRIKEVNRRLDSTPLEACKAYGIGWHLFATFPVFSPNPRFQFMEAAIPNEPAYRELLKVDLVPLASSGGVQLKELRGVDPLAFATDHPEVPLPLHLHCRGADIDVAGLPAGTPVTINYLWYPQMHLYLDGQPVSTEPDDWQRISLTLPRTGTQLALRYDPPWALACALGLGLTLAALLLGWVALRFGEKG
jgi:hypothetical protein